MFSRQKLMSFIGHRKQSALQNTAAVWNNQWKRKNYNEFSFTLVAFLIFTSDYLGASTADIMPSSLATCHTIFAANIFETIALERIQQNVVLSPASIQSCLTLAFLGAEQQTEQQIRSALHLPTALDKASIAEAYGTFLKKNFRATEGKPEDAPKLRMANRIYVNDQQQLSPQFNQLAKASFDSEAVPTKFADFSNATASINKWVENQTDGKITNLLQSDAVSADTSAILVNAIYFKAKWMNPFSTSRTFNAEFMMPGGRTATVPMMHYDEHLKFAELRELDAKVLELPYEASDLSMLILLPNKVDGLRELEQKLAKEDLSLLAQQMKVERVDVVLPKFRIEFEIDLKQPLQKLGMVDMFSDSADFSSLFAERQSQKVEEVKHKAILDVNEAGSDAAAATFTKYVLLSSIFNFFKADHPFVFAIRNKEAVYFVGHVAEL